MTKYERFWLDHDLSGIPDHLFKKIGFLKKSYLEKIDSSEIIKNFITLNKFLNSAQSVKAVIPIYSKDHTFGLKEIIEKNIKTQLIFTDVVLNKTIDAIGEKTFNKLISNYDFDLFITDEKLKLSCLVTNEFFVLGLFSNNDIFDSSQDLNSTDIKAIQWGNELFEYHKGKARKYFSD